MFRACLKTASVPTGVALGEPSGVAFDSATGDLYASNDWGVLKRANGSSDWEVAAPGLPMVEVAGLVIAPNARKLYAATHGRSAWQLTLP